MTSAQEQFQAEVPALFKLNTKVSHRYLWAGVETQALYLLLEIIAVPDLSLRRLPLNLCVVLDRSTSMKGARLEQVKQGLQQIIDQLAPQDALSIVSFSDQAEVVLPSQHNFDKSKAKATVNLIRASGGTEMLQGLTTGLAELERYWSPQGISHMLFLTDGQTYGDEEDCLEVARQAAQNQIGITTLGMGDDWNENLLDQIALITGSTTIYIDSPRQIVDLFESLMHTLCSVVTQALTLHIKPEPGLVLQQAYQLAPHILPLDHRNPKQIALGPLAADVGKTLLLEFHVHAHEVDSASPLLQLVVQDDMPMETDSQTWVATEIDPEFAPEASKNTDIPSAIVNALAKLTIYKMQEKVMSDLENGAVGTVTQRLEMIATRLLNIGETELAQVALLESGRLAHTGTLSSEGRKKIRYGTRTLSLLSQEVTRD